MASLRVGIDVSALALTRAGTARHIRALLDALGHEDVDVRRYALGGSSRALVPMRDLGWYLAALPTRARRDRMEVLHCPTQRAPTRSSVPLVVTVHDLAVLRHPETFNRWTRTYSRLVLPRVTRAARRLIAVSEFTKRELLELLDVPEEKVRVIPNAVGEPFTQEGEAEPGDYVLAVSTLEPRKNLPRLVEAYRRAGLNGVPLLVAGAAGWGDVRVEGDGVRWLGEVATRSWPGSTAARAASRTSRSTRASDFRCWRRWPAARRSSRARSGALEEVAGDAAVLVDPLDPDAIAAGLNEAIDAQRGAAPAGPRASTRLRLATMSRGRPSPCTAKRPEREPSQMAQYGRGAPRDSHPAR